MIKQFSGSGYESSDVMVIDELELIKVLKQRGATPFKKDKEKKLPTIHTQKADKKKDKFNILCLYLGEYYCYCCGFCCLICCLQLFTV